MSKRMLLSAPVRLYWELRPVSSGGMLPEKALAVASEVAEMKVFFVTVRLAGGVRDDLASIVTGMADAGVNVKLSVADTGSLPGADAVAAASGLELYVDSPDGDLGEALDILNGASVKAGLSPSSVAAVPSRKNAGSFEGFFGRCVELGFTSISLPNPCLVSNPAGAGPYILDGLSRHKIREAAESVLSDMDGGVKLFVHELFLYRELKLPGMGERMEYAGCQAAEALAYIGPDGRVYPCSSWPESIGSLDNNSFREIWFGSKRREVVRRIGDLPGKCEECSDSETCLGGCRGMAIAVLGADGPDPGCPVVLDD